MKATRAALVLLAALTVVACSHDRAAEAPAIRQKKKAASSTSTSTTMAPAPIIAGLGDSQLFEAATQFSSLFPGLQVEVHAVPGLTIGDGRYGLHDLAALQPAAVGVVLGTNDALSGSTADYTSSVGELAGMLAEEPCVQWLDVPTSTRDERFNAEASKLNAVLASEAAKHPSLHVVPWSAQVAAHPEWFRDDGIHFTPSGHDALAKELADAVRTCPPFTPAGVPPTASS